MNTKWICYAILIAFRNRKILSVALQSDVKLSTCRLDLAIRAEAITHRKSCSRRQFGMNHAVVFGVGILPPHLFSAPCTVNAAGIPLKEVLPRETSVGEALRRSAANIPGYGPTDVFYPLSWQGTWTLRRENLVPNSTALEIYTYPFRFIPSVDKDAVISDRTYNERNYLEAVMQKGGRRTTAGNIVQTIQWTETNPNDLNILFTNGLQRNVKITKRASELTNTTVSYSEFQRILEDTTSMNGSTVPKLASRRTLIKWKMINSNHIEGIELVYDMNVEGDADRIDLSVLKSNDKSRQPYQISKSRLYLDR